MGLDTSHDCWHGSYSGFHKFRTYLADLIGIKLGNMQGYAVKNPIKWDSIPYNGLHELLNHSDCDGKLTVLQCKKLLKGLKEILKVIPRDNEWCLLNTKDFIRGLESAIQNKESVDFH